MPLSSIQQIPPGNMVLLVGPPGSGKSTFCNTTVLKTIHEKPIIYVTTEAPPTKVTEELKELGLSKTLPNPIYFVDSYNKTIGLSETADQNVENASSGNLVSVGIAITKLQRKLKNHLLVFDSLTSPYLMNGSRILNFLRKILLRIASEGNSVLASFDEGCGKTEDLVAMMTIANGTIKIELQEKYKTYNVIKHPTITPSKIKVQLDIDPKIQFNFNYKLRALNSAKGMRLMQGPPIRKEVGDLVHVFWLNLGRWSGMLWDPKRFPRMEYTSNKCMSDMIKDVKNNLPWRIKLLLKIFIPKSFSTTKDMKKLSSFAKRKIEGNRSAIGKYQPDISRTDEHYFRWNETDTCWGFENIGAKLALGTLGAWAGYMKGYEKGNRDWNIIETKCVGLGDPYCEIKAVPGEIVNLESWLESIDNEVIEKIFTRLMDEFTAYLQGKPLWNRPTLGPYVSLLRFSDILVLPAIESVRYREALRLGGVIAGKRIGERMLKMTMTKEEAIKNIINFLEYCKVGKVSIGKSIRIRECCESVFADSRDHSCFFTTGFLNGFISTVKNQYIQKTKCIAVGNSHCEWEIK